jgi:hypothetical protein
VLLFRLGDLNDAVFAHETGHIFHACDEYFSSNCSCTQTCGGEDVNGNCEVCNPQSRDCMMKFNTFHLCGFTPGQLGWNKMPCAPSPPAPLPAPTLTMSSPATGQQGVSVTITVDGTNFFPGVKVEIDDVFANTTTLIGNETLIVEATVFNEAPLGMRDVTVRNRDDQTVTLANAFEVLPTRQHYYSPTGGNVFPYVTPAGAAISITDAMNATFDGDTLFMVTTTLNLTTLSIDRAVLLHGAWDNTFTTRDLATGKTVIDLGTSSHIVVFPGSNGAGLDGFIVQNGRGAFSGTPFAAYFGGGVRVLDSDATIANCEFMLNAAAEGSNYGVGGAIYAQNGAIEIRDTNIHQNAATQGGGVYLLNCTGSLSNVTLDGNGLNFAAEPARGGGLFASGCNLSVSNLAATGNLGAVDGGGVHVESSTISFDGGQIAGQTASTSGGGLSAVASDVSLSGVEISGNSATGLFGGGVASTQTVALSASDCAFFNNSATLGAGLYTSDGDATVNHNIFYSNNATATGGAVFVTNAGTGSVIGNTVDGNTSGGVGVGGMAIAGSPIDVFNNIVTNSTGIGLSCGGVNNSYNLVWNNSGGDYSGCSPGSGAISVDPLFVNAGAMDYHLAMSSPAIDAGNPDNAYDDPDGSRGDIGYYGSHAFTMDQPSYPKTLAAAIESNNVVLSWDPNPEGDIANYAIYCDSTSGFTPSPANFVTTAPGGDSTASLGAPGDSAFYRISAVDTDGYASGYSNEASLSPPTAIGDPVMPAEFALRQNVPNPFNPVTTIAYDLQSQVLVTLEVYDVDGRLVKRLVNEPQESGRHTALWDATNSGGARVASGIYFYRLRAGSFTDTRKMVLLK